jgi:hypothetical protein
MLWKVMNSFFDEETVLLGQKQIVHTSVKDAFGMLLTGWHLANGHGLCVLELDGTEVCMNRKV